MEAAAARVFHVRSVSLSFLLFSPLLRSFASRTFSLTRILCIIYPSIFFRSSAITTPSFYPPHQVNIHPEFTMFQSEVSIDATIWAVLVAAFYILPWAAVAGHLNFLTRLKGYDYYMATIFFGLSLFPFYDDGPYFPPPVYDYWAVGQFISSMLVSAVALHLAPMLWRQWYGNENCVDAYYKLQKALDHHSRCVPYERRLLEEWIPDKIKEALQAFKRDHPDFLFTYKLEDFSSMEAQWSKNESERKAICKWIILTPHLQLLTH